MREAFAALTLTIGLVASTPPAAAATAAPSACKGLDNAACVADPACKWQPERIAGQTLTTKGEPAKTSAKAHCRKGPKPKAAPSAT